MHHDPGVEELGRRRVGEAALLRAEGSEVRAEARSARVRAGPLRGESAVDDDLMSPDTAHLGPLISRNFGKLVLDCIDGDFLQIYTNSFML